VRPDADPTTCGVTTDQDWRAASGNDHPQRRYRARALKINANLILGNAADSGSGGGLRLQHVNGNRCAELPERPHGLPRPT